MDFIDNGNRDKIRQYLLENMPDFMLIDEDISVVRELLAYVFGDIWAKDEALYDLGDLDTVPEEYLPGLSSLIGYKYDNSIMQEFQRFYIKRFLEIRRSRGNEKSIKVMLSSFNRSESDFFSDPYTPEIEMYEYGINDQGYTPPEGIEWKKGCVAILLPIGAKTVELDRVQTVIPAGIKIVSVMFRFKGEETYKALEERGGTSYVEADMTEYAFKRLISEGIFKAAVSGDYLIDSTIVGIGEEKLIQTRLSCEMSGTNIDTVRDTGETGLGKDGPIIYNKELPWREDLSIEIQPSNEDEFSIDTVPYISSVETTFSPIMERAFTGFISADGIYISTIGSGELVNSFLVGFGRATSNRDSVTITLSE